MLNQVVSAFILKSEQIMEENPDITMWCWRISAGDRRSRKKVVESSQDWIADAQDLIDVMWEALSKLEGEPVDNAWIELLAKGQSRIFHYEHVEVAEPTEQPQMILPDGKRVGISDNYSNAVMATQLVKTNDQLLSLGMGQARMISNMAQKQMDVAIAYTELETEGRMRGEFDSSNNMAEALKVLGPMLQAALLKWGSTTPGQQVDPPDVVEVESPPETPSEASEGVSDTEVDDLLDRFEFVCKFHPDLLTESRVARVVTAFSATSL